MSFDFKARVLLELGAELISSDQVAIYELVKNSLDALATEVHIDIEIALQYSAYSQLVDLIDLQIALIGLGKEPDFTAEELNNHIFQSLDEGAPESALETFKTTYGCPETYIEAKGRLTVAYHASSYIEVRDNGLGMSEIGIKKNYLTVGTSDRLTQKQVAVKQALDGKSRFDYTTTNTKLPLGEKGIGRLSAMRLGHHILLRTKQKDAKDWNVLDMDWRPAVSDPNMATDDPLVDFKPKTCKCKTEEFSASGTRIVVRDLQSDWARKKVSDLAMYDLAKMADPFEKPRANKIFKVTYQGQSVKTPFFNEEPLSHCDAIVDASLRYDNGNAKLRVTVNYQTYKKERTTEISGEHLRACVREEPGRKNKEILVDAEAVARAINHLGPWEARFYWFNRGRLRTTSRPLYDSLIKDFLDQWAGGLHVYRDGYRVYPYGERSDDWLDLDRRALSASAYKLNRAQIVGYLRISTIANPLLLDQTNREGFRHSSDKEALRRLLRWVIIGNVKSFLEQVDKAQERPLEDVKKEVEERISGSKTTAVESLRSIQRSAPEQAQNVATVMHALDEVTDAWEKAKLRIESLDKEIEGFIHLAGVGLMLEFIAHELSRVTQDTLKAIASGRLSPQAIEVQLKTLEKRVRILDELSIPGRQIRQPSNIQQLVELLVDFHQGKAERLGINIIVHKENHKHAWEERVEKGQILQILDNLLSNSFYWLDNRFKRSPPGEIHISLDKRNRKIAVRDNGPGISADRTEAVFEKFDSTKPPKEGRGLGLYIARHLALENGATLQLGTPDNDGMFRTFILEFGLGN